VKDISKIDKNLKIETKIGKDGVRFYDVKNEPFRVHGLIYEDGWRRMPASVAESVSDAVAELSVHTAGGRVRFVTDSPYVAIKAVQPQYGLFKHMAATGQSGFDIYSGEGKNPTYVKTFVPTLNQVKDGGYESIVELGEKALRTITVNFPLYYGVTELYIGLDEDAVLLRAKDYAHPIPAVYYGSSVTQGGCASRPGNSYQGFISRWLDIDHINLGFSGSARGEVEMAEYIAGLDMSVFVMDYDYNAPSIEHLEATHERFFKIIRARKPTLPIIILSRPRYDLRPDDKRNCIIRKTYENARAAGDENVYFIGGWETMEISGCEGTVDGTHPTDFGFYSMATRIARDIERVI